MKLTIGTLQLLAAASFSAPYAAQAQTVEPVAIDQERSLVCLAQAISYEAGNESIAGQEAVAQVVINRLRHPAYPKTICGVVYQGSTRKTGCQFTFTCDGSLRRPRSSQSMATATEIAKRVLAGGISPLVRGATHYHADYVAPYWAPSLVRIAQIGAHIFYRMPGAPDTPAYADMTIARTDPQTGGDTDALTRSGGAVRVSPTPSQFAPWGLPTLTISPSGEIRTVGR